MSKFVGLTMSWLLKVSDLKLLFRSQLINFLNKTVQEMSIHVLEWMLFKKKSVLSLKEKTTQNWFSYFQIVLNYLKSTMSSMRLWSTDGYVDFWFCAKVQHQFSVTQILNGSLLLLCVVAAWYPAFCFSLFLFLSIFPPYCRSSGSLHGRWWSLSPRSLSWWVAYAQSWLWHVSVSSLYIVLGHWLEVRQNSKEMLIIVNNIHTKKSRLTKLTKLKQIVFSNTFNILKKGHIWYNVLPLYIISL